jgi:putative membrane protein
VARVLNESTAEQIRAAIERAETRTAAEFVVVETRASDTYAAQRAALALVLLLGVSLALYYSVPSLPSDVLLLLQIPLGVLAWWLAGRPVLLRAFIPRDEASSRVDLRAKQLFMDHGLSETRDHSAVLILVSALERQVEILPDRGVGAVVDTREWRRHVAAITGGIRAGRAADGITEVIERLASELAEALPPRSDDRNELRDAVTHVED